MLPATRGAARKGAAPPAGRPRCSGPRYSSSRSGSGVDAVEPANAAVAPTCQEVERSRELERDVVRKSRGASQRPDRVRPALGRETIDERLPGCRLIAQVEWEPAAGERDECRPSRIPFRRFQKPRAAAGVERMEAG